jgi:endonuclease YncB( thermonuclease family)
MTSTTAPSSTVPTLTPVYEYNATVVRVIDGDSVVIDIHKDVGFGVVVNLRQTVRMKGIDAPETVGATRKEGLASKALLASILPVGTPVIVRTEKPDPRDKYGRFLATIWKEGLDLSEHMVTVGAAVAYDGGKRE